MTEQELRECYLSNGWALYEEGKRVVRFTRGRFLATIVELRADDWRSTTLVDRERPGESPAAPAADNSEAPSS